MPRLFTYVFAALLLVGGGGAPANAGSTSRATASRAGTATDAQIDATIRAKLAKSKIGKDGFKFHVQRGVVTWEGNTNVMQHKGSATRMARSAGALQVVNNIHVMGTAKDSGNLKRATVQP